MSEPRTKAGREHAERWIDSVQIEWGLDPGDRERMLAEIAAIEVEAGELGAAWAEAEAALPEGWHVCAVRVAHPPDEEAIAEAIRSDGNPERATGPTPAAALRALAAKLGEVGR